jgi:hypothetical protein
MSSTTRVLLILLLQREEERRLLRDALLLWVAVRMSSTTEWICGDDHLDMSPVTDTSSPYWQHMPIPPVMSAQGQIIAYSKILKPLKESVVKQLSSMDSAADTRKYWFTIYLTYFVLLHSCALVTRRNEEYARQIDAKVGFKEDAGQRSLLVRMNPEKRANSFEIDAVRKSTSDIGLSSRRRCPLVTLPSFK